MAGAGNRVLAGADRALDLLRSLPRLSLGNLKSNPKAFQQVHLSMIETNEFYQVFIIIFFLSPNVEEGDMGAINMVLEIKVQGKGRTL